MQAAADQLHEEATTASISEQEVSYAAAPEAYQSENPAAEGTMADSALPDSDDDFFRPYGVPRRVESVATGVRRLEILQEWDGLVEASGPRSFTARIADPADEKVEIVDIPIEEVSPDERPRIAPGALFYWSIGRETSKSGTVSRVSTIYFRRLPGWTRSAERAAEAGATTLAEALGVDRDELEGRARNEG